MIKIDLKFPLYKTEAKNIRGTVKLISRKKDNNAASGYLRKLSAVEQKYKKRNIEHVRLSNTTTIKNWGQQISCVLEG